MAKLFGWSGETMERMDDGTMRRWDEWGGEVLGDWGIGAEYSLILKYFS
jgi:hypothetical protein